MSGLTACLWTLLSLGAGPQGVVTQASSIPNGECEAGECETEDDIASLLAARRSGGHICGGQNAPCSSADDLTPLDESFIFMLFQSINTPHDGVVNNQQMEAFLNLGGCLHCAETLLGVPLQLLQQPASPVQLRQAPPAPPPDCCQFTKTPAACCDETPFPGEDCCWTTTTKSTTTTTPTTPTATITTSTTTDSPTTTTPDSPSTTNNPAVVAVITKMLLPKGPATYDQFVADLQQTLANPIQATADLIATAYSTKATAALIAYHGEDKVKSLVQTSSQLSNAGRDQLTKNLDQSLGSKACI